MGFEALCFCHGNDIIGSLFEGLPRIGNEARFLHERFHIENRIKSCRPACRQDVIRTGIVVSQRFR